MVWLPRSVLLLYDPTFSNAGLLAACFCDVFVLGIINPEDRQYAPAKHQLTFNGLCSVIPRMIEPSLC
jgi:hypothetical protein